MKVVKWLSVIFGVYVAFVVLFESVYLGYFQPSFEESGIPMLLLTTTDADGKTSDRMLARFRNRRKNLPVCPSLATGLVPSSA